METINVSQQIIHSHFTLVASWLPTSQQLPCYLARLFVFYNKIIAIIAS